jgi:drug/metabolite transporter (DMT)-like permease
VGVYLLAYFISLLYLHKKMALRSTTIASKMSLVIPTLLAVYLYDETFSLQKTTGLLMALAAVYLSARGGNNRSSESGWTLPLLVFAGAGLVDASIKYTQNVFTDNEGSSSYFSLVFFSAAVIGSYILLFSKNKSLASNKFSNIIAGIILGVFNFISLYFMIAALQEFHEDSGKAFILINSGVVLLNFLLSIILFHENKNKQSWFGVVLAIVAIIILSH